MDIYSYGEPQEERHTMVLRKTSFFSSAIRKSGAWAKEKSFQTRLINGKTFSLIIDSGSCTNVVAQSLVDSLKLKVQEHPKPQKSSWLSDNGEV